MQKKPLELRRIFIQSVSRYLKCPVCMQVFTKPRRLNCGHTFCKPCLQRLFLPHKNPQHKPSCPICRQEIDVKKIGYDEIAKIIIDQIQVMCPVKGCPWKGQNQLLQTHYTFSCAIKNQIGERAVILDKQEESSDSVKMKVKQNTQKGSVIARVLSKNPQISQMYLGASRRKRQRLVSRGVQTDQ